MCVFVSPTINIFQYEKCLQNPRQSVKHKYEIDSICQRICEEYWGMYITSIYVSRTSGSVYALNVVKQRHI